MVNSSIYFSIINNLYVLFANLFIILCANKRLLYLPPKALDGVLGVDVGLPAWAATLAAAALTAASPAKDDALIGPPGPLVKGVE